MTKIFNKLLLVGVSTCLLSNLAFAQDTTCYKNGVEKPSLIEDITLDGGICNGKFSLNQMKNNGWDVLDIKINSSQNKFNYTYYFTKNTNSNQKANNVLLKTSITEPTTATNKEFSVKPMGLKIGNIENNKSIIPMGNLIIGQTGIVVHIFDNDKRLIVSNAKVISSDLNSSVIEFFEFKDLTQDAIPTSNRVVTTNDILILNYMYNSSLLITPTLDSFQSVRENFKLNNFVHSDIFAAKLKVDHKPYPTKEDIQNFAIEQNLGTIFMVIENKVYIIDSKTFTILESYAINYENAEAIMPFYTRVEEIEESIFNLSFFDFFSGEKNLSYNEYYKRILGIK
ncbi:hypothetical protein CKA55_12165 [Arcobacter suis]|uniref:Plasminogen-binding protein PgbA N-terminal domain-containing protein n=1 Tax=Arcobacter suis CECT 7833 TaxID=663365 RepID=A0AAD0SSH0_9BACT|nr:plasminogen-binding N-terminal domain-containing protein [Arcobacter suis]AXX90565.1 hypothetical protein ASUIS_2128 [Arcobacter suis CECT 7833]RWS45576.1 hypothetical protein CKA55_12165 [Arcobacter suis]